MQLTARITVITFALLLLSGPSPVLAKNVSQSVSVDQNLMMGTKSPMMGDPLQNRVEKTKTIVERLLNKYSNRIDRYEEFLTRVKSRRDKLAGEGKDVAKLDTFLASAGDNIKKARTVLATVKVKLEVIDNSTDKQVVKTKIIPEFRKLRSSLTNLHTSMSQAVAKLKEVNASKLKTISGENKQE